MNRIRLIRVVVIGLITTTLAIMPLVSQAWSGYQQVTVIIITVYQSGKASPPGVLIQFSPTTPTDTENCAQSGHGYAWIDFSSTGEPDGKALYAMVLAAQMSGRTLGIGVNGCNSQGIPMVYGINTYPQ